MEGPVAGDVVILSFPFSDLRGAKRRPGLVLASAGGDDLLICQITRSAPQDPLAVPLAGTDLAPAGLKVASFVRPLRIFTADRRLVRARAGRLPPEIHQTVVDRLIQHLRPGGSTAAPFK